MGMVGHLLCQESSWLEPIVGPELQALNAAACLEPGVLARARLLQGLRMLAALLCGLTQEEPQAALLEHILQRAGPAMAAVVDNYCQDTQLVEVLFPHALLSLRHFLMCSGIATLSLFRWPLYPYCCIELLFLVLFSCTVFMLKSIKLDRGTFRPETWCKRGLFSNAETVG